MPVFYLPVLHLGQKGETIKKLQAETGGHFSMVRNAAHRGMQVVSARSQCWLIFTTLMCDLQATVKGDVQCQCRLMYHICRAIAKAQAKSDTELTVPSAPSFPAHSNVGHRYNNNGNYYNVHNRYGSKGGKGGGNMGMQHASYNRRQHQQRQYANNNVTAGGSGANAGANTAANANVGIGDSGIRGGRGGSSQNLGGQGGYAANQMALQAANMAATGADGTWDGSEGQAQGATMESAVNGLGMGQQMGAVMGMGMGLGGLGGQSNGNHAQPQQQQWSRQAW